MDELANGEGVSNDYFSDEVHQDALGLIYLGSLDKTVHIGGHSFRIRTLKVGEELSIGLIIKEFADTVTLGKAVVTATVAASLEEVDGRAILAPLGPDIHSYIRSKFVYLKDNWYFVLIDALYNEYNELLNRQLMAFQELELK